MARAGIAVDDSVECVGIGAGEASNRLLELAEATGQYRAVSVGADRFQFARAYRPTWAIVLACSFVWALGLGLLFLLVKSSETLTATVEQDHRSTRIRLTGKIMPNLLVAIRAALGSDAARRPVAATEHSWVAGGVPVRTTAGGSGSTPALTPAAPAPAPGVVGPPPGFERPGTAPIPPPPSTPSTPVAPVAPVTAPVHPVPTDSPTHAPVAPVGAQPSAPAAGHRPANRSTLAAPVDLTRGLSGQRTPSSIGAEGPALMFDWGLRVPVAPFVLIGRDPEGRADEPPAVLVPVDDPGRSVSKTHLAVYFDDSGAHVVDRGSTNGTAVELPGGAVTEARPGELVSVSPGATIRFGQRRVTLVGILASGS
jgi:hypothetical protein